MANRPALSPATRPIVSESAMPVTAAHIARAEHATGALPRRVQPGDLRAALSSTRAAPSIRSPPTRVEI